MNKASKHIVALFEQERNPTPRDIVRAYLLSGGEYNLTDKAKELLDRAVRVKEILHENRGDIATAKRLIKAEFDTNHRMEVERMIEDAVYLYGIEATSKRSYQIMLQLQDIEWGIKLAKETNDLEALAKFINAKTKLLRLDEPDDTQSTDAFININIYMEFRPQDFKHALPDDWQQRANRIKYQAMKALGMIEDIPEDDVEYTEQ